MRFSLIYEAQTVDASRAGDRKVFEEMVEQAELADKMGFDVLWCVEHTALTNYAHMSVPETFLAYIAGRTKQIGLGHGVVCLPPAMNHPVKVAERVALLDILSKGRVHFGVGKGGTQQESGTFGYDLAELQPQIDESMYLIPKIMVQDEIEHNGKYVQIPRRPIHPKPFQKPHPKMYLACTRDETLLTAGSRALGALVLGFGGPEDIARKNAVYRKAFKERKLEDQVGFRPNEHLAALCPAIVLDDRDKARRIGLRGQRFFAEAINYWYQGGAKPSIDDLSAEEHLAQMEARKSTIGARIGEDKIPASSSRTLLTSEINDSYGTAQDCINYVQKLFDAGADEILFLVQMGTVPHEASMETIRNIGKHVIPHFRKK